MLTGNSASYCVKIIIKTKRDLQLYFSFWVSAVVQGPVEIDLLVTGQFQ